MPKSTQKIKDKIEKECVNRVGLVRKEFLLKDHPLFVPQIEPKYIFVVFWGQILWPDAASYT